MPQIAEPRVPGRHAGHLQLLRSRSLAIDEGCFGLGEPVTFTWLRATHLPHLALSPDSTRDQIVTTMQHLPPGQLTQLAPL